MIKEAEGVVSWGALVTTVRMVVSSVAVGMMMVEKMVSVVTSAPWSFLSAWSLSAVGVGRLLWMREGDKCVELEVVEVTVLDERVYDVPWFWGRVRAMEARCARALRRSAFLVKVRAGKVRMLWLPECGSEEWSMSWGDQSEVNLARLEGLTLYSKLEDSGTRPMKCSQNKTLSSRLSTSFGG